MVYRHMIVKLDGMNRILCEEVEKVERCPKSTLKGAIFPVAGVSVARFLELSGKGQDAISDATSPRSC